MENPSVSRFREYLRINTMQPTPDYDAALAFLKKEADDIGLEFKRIQQVPDRPMGLMTWKGSNPDLKGILLTSHMDVVPVFPEHWKYDPFSAHKEENGDIFARGSQDMKCVSNWYLEAIRRMKSEGKVFPRTIHLLFTADEEIGSKPTETFVQSKEFKDLNVAFGLDEGIANPGDKMRVFYAERSVWWMKVSCTGNPGHGSAFIENTAAEKLHFMIDKFLNFRESEKQRFKANPEEGLGNFTTVNMTMLEGGVQTNVVPAVLSATFDCRVPPTTDFEAFGNKIDQWCKEAGEGVAVTFTQKGLFKEMVNTDDSSLFWRAFAEGCEASDIEIQTEIFPAGTDSRFFRQAGVDMLGFSPMNKTPILLHDHNEFLNEKVFLTGIDTYCQIIPRLASVTDSL